MTITIFEFNLAKCERQLCLAALEWTGSLVEAAALLGTNRHALRRLIAKHKIEWWPYAQQQASWRARDGHNAVTPRQRKSRRSGPSRPGHRGADC